MLKLLLLFGVLCCSVPEVFGTGDIGPGVWKVNYIRKCETDLHKFKFDIIQKKINRTHDGFTANFKLDESFNEDFGIRVDICKYVDGGCKQYQVLSDDCFVNFVNKYAENNVKEGLTMAGFDPPEFPLPAGDYSVSDYIFDYSELPSDAIYGRFCAKGFMLKDTEEVGCVELHVEFKEAQDEDDDDCDDDE
ncbi:hypothetical protein PYW07_006440 [Mythimna separata]|uniref:Uncharacterized protein n=1 Tax=Mythimna separata TaxID=271217 RepID=A0AAD7YVU2_MYTSE|nr:hypothetical protein PYW07_006440 [Mythimna separata]